MYEDTMVERVDIKRSLREELLPTDEVARLNARLRNLDELLGDDEVQDDLVDQWEEQLARGEMPDLDEGP